MQRRRGRQGAALVELAIFLPVYCFIALATIETCRAIYLRQSLKIAAYEAARLGIVPGVTLEDLRLQGTAILEGRRINNFQLGTQPANIGSMRYQDLLTVTISIPTADNALVAPWFYRQRSLNESVCIMVEYDEK